MNHQAKFIWINASPSLKHFHLRLLNNLAKTVEIELWEYYQTLDEGSSIDKAIQLLHEYLQGSDRPVHLIGHGIGGTIALGYARLYPAQVSSLVLLSVAVQPAITWHSYYYTQLRSLPSNRDCILRSIAINLLPYSCVNYVHGLVERLKQDLVESPFDHSLFHLNILSEGGIEMPLMICGGEDDSIVTESAIFGWTHYFKSSDCICIFAEGGHFFHHFHAELVGDRVQLFWQQIEPQIPSNQLVATEI
jgi:pimeloyl-ACP methyl ester carboxylesterase